MGYVLAGEDFILIDGVPSAEQTILGYETATSLPSFFVVGQNVVDDVGAVVDVVVASCN